MEEAKHFIGGAWRAPASGESIEMIDPADGQPFARIARGNAADIETAVAAARAAYDGAWGQTSAAERGRMLFRLSMLIAACGGTSRPSRRAIPASRCAKRAPMQPRSPATSNSTQAPATSSTARPCPINRATR